MFCLFFNSSLESINSYNKFIHILRSKYQVHLYLTQVSYKLSNCLINLVITFVSKKSFLTPQYVNKGLILLVC